MIKNIFKLCIVDVFITTYDQYYIEIFIRLLKNLIFTSLIESFFILFLKYNNITIFYNIYCSFTLLKILIMINYSLPLFEVKIVIFYVLFKFLINNIILDLLAIIFVMSKVVKYREILKKISKLIYSNLTRRTKIHLFFYLFLCFINIEFLIF